MTLEFLPMGFSVCRLKEGSPVVLSIPFSFYARTDGELSLICPSASAPAGAEKTEAGWRCFRVKGPLDFSLVGILAQIAACLADAGISIFAVSTYDTDYVFLKEARLEEAKNALVRAGYALVELA